MMNVEQGKLSIKKNDQVEVIAGREKGKSGKVLRVNRKTGRITVEKVNMIKRHVKPTQQTPQGGVMEREASLHYSNVLLMCAKCNRGVRHGHKWIEKATAKKGAQDEQVSKKLKIRVCKRCNETLETA